jgi:hypothetical protein
MPDAAATRTDSVKLLELDPQWIVRDGKRIGFTFQCPTKREYRQSCFPVPPAIVDQLDLFEVLHGEKRMVQGCNPEKRWTIAGGIDTADFATMTVTPSLDGSPGGLWHGHITAGEIKGGI